MSNNKSQARTAADSEQKDDDMFVSQHSRKPNVGSRFCLSHRVGVNTIRWFSKLFNLSLEKELILGVKWLQFIYHWFPFSLYQRKLFPKRWKLFWLLFWNSPISLFVSVIVATLLSLLIVYLSTKYIMI